MLKLNRRYLNIPYVILLGVFLIFITPHSFASDVDSLKQLLRSTTESETVDLLNQLSVAHANAEWDKSQRYANLALDLSTSLSDKLGQAEAHTNLAQYYLHTQEYRLALDHATEALNEFELLSEVKRIAKSLRIIGEIYRRLNQTDQSLDYFLRSLMIFEDIEAVEQVALTVVEIGDVYLRWSQPEKAQRFFERALEINTQSGSVNGILDSENRLAQTLMVLRKFDDAKTHLEHAVAIADETSSDEHLAKLYTSLGELYYHQYRLHEAQQYFIDALRLKKEFGKAGEVALALSDVGSIYQEINDLDNALSYFKEGQDIAEKGGEISISAEIWLKMGELFVQAGDESRAIHALEQGLFISRSINDLLTLERANLLLAEAHAEFGRLDKALGFQKELLQVRQKLNEQRSNKRTAELEVRYELDKREQELTDLKATAVIRDLEYQKSYTQMWLVLGSVVVLMFMAITFVFYRGRILRKAEREKMEDLLRVKADFIAMLVHDLRSPLTSVFGFAELLKMGEKPYDRIREIAGTIRETSQKMLNLVNEMLDLSRFEAGKMELSLGPAVLKPIIKSATQMLDPVARQKQTTLALNVSDGLPAVLCDPQKVEQVITNFIGNAIEHTQDGSEVEIRLNTEDIKGRPYICFEVQDDGPGVVPEQQHLIFDKYAQFDSKKHKDRLGTGLGLAVSRLIIEEHGGQVGYRDGKPKGSIFYFRLPLEVPKVPTGEQSTN